MTSTSNIDPQRQQYLKETEARRELIKKKYKQYKESSDPEERKRLKQELDQIHTQRLFQQQRDAFKGLGSGNP